MARKERAVSCRVCLCVSVPWCFLAGLAITCLGVGLYLAFPKVESLEVNKKVTVEEGHATYEQLQEPSIPIYKDFYFFNLTNFEEFADSYGNATPIFHEVGPYSYRENRTKKFAGHLDDKDLIAYTQRKIFKFDSKKSHGSSDDIICTINIPLVAAINEAEAAEPSLPLRTALRLLIIKTGAKLYTCQKANDLAWNYTDDFIHDLYRTGQYPSEFINLQVNNSLNDSYQSIIHTGVKDISLIGEFVQWDGLKSLHTWPNGDLTGANDIRGTEGLFFRPGLKEKDNLTVFDDDIQRSIDIVYTGHKVHYGLDSLRFAIDNDTFKSAFTKPRNARWGSWCPDGMFYLGPTQPKEPPVYGSKPHFLDGDPLLLESVKGISPPNRTQHDTIADVEPTTGATLNFFRQLQINVQVNRTKHMHEMSKIVGYNGTGTLYFPVGYINEHATMDEDFKDYLEGKGLNQVETFNIVVPAIFGVLLFVSAVLLLISICMCVCSLCSRAKNKDGALTPLLNPS